MPRCFTLGSHGWSGKYRHVTFNNYFEKFPGKKQQKGAYGGRKEAYI